MIDVKPYIDRRNAALWETVKHSGFFISVEESTEPNYGCYCKGKEAIIYVIVSEPNYASFAHELLHIKFRIEGMLAGSCLKRMMREDPILKEVISLETIDVITNCMEHVKMLPQFLAMGYNNSEFIADYNTKKLNLEGLSILCNWYVADRLRAMDRFIGTYIAIKADNNPTHKYGIYLVLLRLIDSELYKIVECFWTNWLNYDTEKKREIWEPDYGSIISYFVNTLGIYMRKYKCS